MAQFKTLDALDMEFQYYSCLVKDLITMLPNRCEQILASAWFRKLSEAVYNADALRDKRNHYLLMLTICMTLNKLKYPFDKYPSEDALQEVTCINNPKHTTPCPTPQCQAIQELTTISQTCDLHKTECPKDEDKVAKVLDEQFRFLITLAEPYVSKLSDPSDRRRGRKWVSFLSSIQSNCFHMKGVRNDYAMLLAGYLLNDELPGPFSWPPIQTLVPLEEMVNMHEMKNHMAIDPSHPNTLKFFRDVPQPEEGAFAFVAVAGEICEPCVKK